MKPTYRPYQTEEDFWHMREFLRRVFMLNNKLQRSWHVTRPDYARWHVCLNCAKLDLEDVVHLWEPDGRLVAFLMPDGGFGEAHLCVHPGLRTLELEEEMLTVAEEQLADVKSDGSHSLCVWVPEQDRLRQELLMRRGLGKAFLVQVHEPKNAPLPCYFRIISRVRLQGQEGYYD